MRVDRPTPEAYPVLYDDDDNVLSDPNAEHGVDVDAPPDDERAPHPPLGGRGSGVEAWRAYAAEVGLAGAEDLPKGEIVAQLRTLGIIAAGPTPDDDEGDGD